MMKSIGVLAVGISLQAAACASTRPAGPSADELISAMEQAAPEVRGSTRLSPQTLKLAGCHAFENEPTQFQCQFDAKEPSGEWKAGSATVVDDQGRWVVLHLE